MAPITYVVTGERAAIRPETHHAPGGGRDRASRGRDPEQVSRWWQHRQGLAQAYLRDLESETVTRETGGNTNSSCHISEQADGPHAL